MPEKSHRKTGLSLIITYSFISSHIIHAVHRQLLFALTAFGTRKQKEHSIVINSIDYIIFINEFQLTYAICIPTASIHNITPSANNEYSTSSTTSTDHPVPVKRKVSSSSNIQKTSSLKTIATLKPKPERDFYECPNTSQFEFFPAYCTQHTQCLPTGRNYRCCNQFGSKRCVKGIFKPLKEQKHERNAIFIHQYTTTKYNKTSV